MSSSGARPALGPRGFRLALAAGVVAATAWGWWTFWFLTDDAYIAFRYVSNARQGLGLVWNPPPFVPVEGYTSFLWVSLLRAVWRLTGVAPPESANILSLAFGYATLALVYHFCTRMTLPARSARLRPALVALVMLGTVSNRTFLTWLSSGLETALFGFTVAGWIVFALTPADRRGDRHDLALAAFAAASALTRPDGLLLCAATPALWVAQAARRGGPRPRLRSALPLLAIPLHLAWRLSTYGAWLPNTYTAKVVAPWPAAGIRYLASFGVEYGLWLWAGLVVAAAAATAVRGPASDAAPRGASRPALAITVGALAAHAAYYTFVVGGDHFEYRVYAHLVPWLFVSGAWAAARAAPGPAWAVAGTAALAAASWPVAWTHWWIHRDLMAWNEASTSLRLVSKRMPAGLAPLLEPWDGWQLWLNRRHVGQRHHQHRAFTAWQQARLPTREEGRRIGWSERAVYAEGSVGLVGWVLPEVAIIDVLGLSDRVIARSPVDPGRRRHMAHDRVPPPGYVGCFRPNVRIEAGRVELRPRLRPLTDDAIRACESRHWHGEPP